MSGVILRRPNPRLQRPRPAPLRSPLSRKPLGVRLWLPMPFILHCALMLLLARPDSLATVPLGPQPFPDEEVLLLLDMGARDVRPETVDTVVQALLAHDFGTHFQMAGVLGWAVRERMVTETEIREAFARYACDHAAMRDSFACRFSIEAFEGGLRFGDQARQRRPVPECLGSGADLFQQDGFQKLSEAFYYSIGDPEVVALARSIPTVTLEAIEHPKGVVVINGPTDLNPWLFCTLHAWRQPEQPPNRFIAFLETLRCRAK